MRVSLICTIDLTTFIVFLFVVFSNDFAIFACSFIVQKEESFYTLSWACNLDGTPFLVAGGINGIIRVIDAGSEKIHKVLHSLCVQWEMLKKHFSYWFFRRSHTLNKR